MPKQRGSESGKEAMISRGMDGPEKVGSESGRTRVSRREAAAEIEAGGRRKEIADETIR